MRKIYIPNKERVIKRFLFRPKLIYNEKRWLEVAEIEQKLLFINNKWKWVNTKFKN